MIQAFAWSARFATGIASVDEQHRHLVDLVNRLGAMRVDGGTVDEAALQTLFHQLADYARFHFADEERVMAEAGVDAGHAELHRQHHRGFTEQVVAMWQGRAAMSRPIETLHDFLAAWLTYHILGEDQVMAREAARIRAGEAPAAAHAAETVDADTSTAALLDALQTLYGVLSRQNRDLAAANTELEARVTARTGELNAAYAKLEAEHRELTELLAKVEQVQGQLLQSEKMASIGQLAAGVAHEINNPVGFVSSNLGTLARYAAQLLELADAAADSPAAQRKAAEIDLPFLREDLPTLLDESRDGLERVRRIVANLKDFSHVDEAEWQQADLIAGLESTVSVAWHELKYKAELRRELQPLPPVRCMPAQINQVLLNLLTNAAQALDGRGTITLRSGVDGNDAWLEVEDNGKGMDEATRRRMFDPFFTTKPVGQGTGLGLSLSWDIVRQHGGRFEVDSAPGRGTRIRLRLPVAGPAETP